MIKFLTRFTGLLLTMFLWAFIVFLMTQTSKGAYIGLLIGAVAFGLAYKFRYYMPRGVAMAGVYVEVWTGELVKQFNDLDQIGWMAGIGDYSQYVNNSVIHLVDVGVDPDVLLNNTTYPIAIQDLGDGDIAISLDKWQTKATRVTDDELYAMSYDIIALKREQHGTAISVNKYQKAIHAMAPAANTTATPVLITTGAATTDGTNRLKLQRTDIVAFKKLCDKAKWPKVGRRLVLCTDHIADLLESDQKFQDQYYNYTTGKIANLYGFEVYEYDSNPYFKVSDKTKLAYGGTPVAGTHNQASVAFVVSEMFMASGATKMYYSEAALNPTTQENLINFRHYFITLPKKQRAIGAIVSGISS